MSDERFERWNDHSCKVKDNQEDTFLNWEGVVNKLNEQQSNINKLQYENELLKDENEQYKALLENKWSEYLKKKELFDDE